MDVAKVGLVRKRIDCAAPPRSASLARWKPRILIGAIRETPLFSRYYSPAMLFDVWDAVYNSPATGLLLSVALLLFGSWLWREIKTPGPWGIPILGFYPFLRKDYYRQLHELSEKYGEVYIINIAGQKFVYLDSIRAIREAHITKSDCFFSRSEQPGIFLITMGEGVAFLNGEQWRALRKFFVQAMREIRLVPKTPEQKGPIENAIQEALLHFQKNKDEPVEILPVLTKQCTAVVLRLILGEDITEEEETRMSEAYTKVLAPMLDLNVILLGKIASWLILPRTPGYKEMLESGKEMKALLRNIVERHDKSFSADEPPRDLIDLYLRERMIKKRREDATLKHFTDGALIATLEQIYGDGSVTIAMFIASYLLAISQYPEVQDSVHEEITRVVGTERLPTWEDRPNLPLTYSTILEHLRKGTFVTLFSDLECTKETTVLGVKVPKGCVSLLNMWAVHNNPETYENPDQFDASRFLPEKKAEPLTTFGVGKRACIGENLVMTEMFLFISSVLQNFKILPESASTGDFGTGQDLEAALSGRVRFTARPESRYAS